MAENEIKTLQFNQGVALVPVPVILDDSGNLSMSNNVAATGLALTFDLTLAREVVIDYQIYRKTDAPVEMVEIGVLRLSARPLKAVEADKWVLTQPVKIDDGTDAGITFSIEVAAGIVTLKYASTDLAGANHECIMFYSLRTMYV